jgi:hypothetical protein
MSKCRIEDYDDEVLNEEEDYHFKKTTKKHHEQYKEYNGRKSKAKNKFKKMRGNKDKYED